MNTLDFNISIKEIFHYLITQYHFLICHDELSIVSYENEKYIINFSIEKGSYSIFVDIEIKERKEIYSLYELMQVIAIDDSNDVICQAKNNYVLKKKLAKIKTIINENCEFILSNDISKFNTLFPLLIKNRKEYTNNFRFGAIKEKANIAWEAKNYKEAYKLYDTINDNLTKKEKRRYKFLKKKL